MIHTCYSYGYLKTAEKPQNVSSMRKGEEGLTADKFMIHEIHDTWASNTIQDVCSNHQREVTINI